MKKDSIISFDVFVSKKYVSAFYRAIKESALITDLSFKFLSDAYNKKYLCYTIQVHNGSEAFHFGCAYAWYLDNKMKRDHND